MSETAQGQDWREMTPEMFDTTAKPLQETLFAPDSQGRFGDLFSESGEWEQT
jgi:hypothetical protein